MLHVRKYCIGHIFVFVFDILYLTYYMLKKTLNVILYKYFQELNTIAIDQYTNLSHSATQIKDSLHDLDVKYKLLLPYLEQLNQLGKFLELKFY